MSKEEAQYNKLRTVFNRLTLSVPFNGILIETAPNLKQGMYVIKNEWLGDVIMPDIIRIVAFAEQGELHLIKKGSVGYFYPSNLSYSKVPVQIAFIDVLNVNALDCAISQEVERNKSQEYVVDTACYNSSDLGGGVATYNTTEGKYVPIDSIYRIVLTTSEPVKINVVERGTVVLKTKSHSYAGEFFKEIKTILITQSGF